MTQRCLSFQYLADHISKCTIEKDHAGIRYLGFELLMFDLIRVLFQISHIHLLYTFLVMEKTIFRVLGDNDLDRSIFILICTFYLVTMYDVLLKGLPLCTFPVFIFSCVQHVQYMANSMTDC